MDDGRVMLRHLIFQFQSPTCLSAPRQAGLVSAPPAMGLDKNDFIEGASKQLKYLGTLKISKQDRRAN